MGFVAGFSDQLNKIIDRKERRDLLKDELNTRRQETLIELQAKLGKRQGAAADQTAAIQALTARVGETEGGKEWVTAVAKSGKAGEVLSTINDLELKDPSKELRLQGSALIDGFRPFYTEQGRPDVKLPNPETILQTDLSDSETWLRTLRQTQQAVVNQSAPRVGVVDVNPQAAFSASNKSREDVTREFDRLLVTSVAEKTSKGTDEENAKLVRDINALQGTNETAKANARTRLKQSPEGFRVFMDLMDAADTIPAYGAIAGLLDFRDFAEVRREILPQLPNLKPENKEAALRMWPYLRDYIN